MFSSFSHIRCDVSRVEIGVRGIHYSMIYLFISLNVSQQMKRVKFISPHIHYILSPYFFHMVSDKMDSTFSENVRRVFFIKDKMKWKNKIIQRSGCVFFHVKRTKFFLVVKLFNFESEKSALLYLHRKRGGTSIKFVWLSEEMSRWASGIRRAIFSHRKVDGSNLSLRLSEKTKNFFQHRNDFFHVVK